MRHIDLENLPVFAHDCPKFRLSDKPGETDRRMDSFGYVGGKTCPFCKGNLLDQEVRSRIDWIAKQLGTLQGEDRAALHLAFHVGPEHFDEALQKTFASAQRRRGPV